MGTAVKGAGNATLTYNANDVSDYVSDLQLQQTIDELESTNLASTGKEFEPGLGDFNATLTFVKWDATLDGYLYPDVLTPGTKRTAVLTFTDAGGTTVTYTWTSNAFLTQYQIGAQPSQLIGGDSGIRLCGAPARTAA